MLIFKLSYDRVSCMSMSRNDSVSIPDVAGAKLPIQKMSAIT
jgi:hypothetical protein